MNALRLTLIAVVLPSTALAGHNSRLAVSADGRRLVAANADNASISIVDLRARELVVELPVGRRPESVCLLGGSTLAAVAAFDDDRVVIVDIEAKRVVRRIEVPDEPYGIVARRDGSRLYVTHSNPGLLTEIDPGMGVILRRIDLGDSPRGIAFSNDETKLYVTHYYTGVITVVDVATGSTIDRWKGSDSDNLAASITVHPSRPLAYVPHIRSRVARSEATASIFPFLGVLDLSDRPDPRRIPIAMDAYNGIRPVADPAEVALSPDGKRLYIIYAGTDDMNVAEAVDGYPYLQPLSGLIPLGANPRGVAVSPDGSEVYVLNALDFSVRIYRAEPLERVADLVISTNPFSPEILRGKRLFNMATMPMTARRWIACASCHPGGDHDGRTWKNPEGPRNTTSMVGMSRTGPLHWSADRDEAQDFEHTIRSRLMQGGGLVPGRTIPAELGEPMAGRSADLDALAAYCNSLEPTLSPHAAGLGKLTPSADRGRVLFESAAVGCATCHAGPMYTDSRLDAKPFAKHDVGTGTGDPAETLGPSFDTPSLVGLYRSAPYMHDGRAATIEEVLTTANVGDKHGRTSALSKSQLDDLSAFLRSLPYRAESMGGP